MFNSTEAEKTIITIIGPVIYISGFCGNILCLFIFLRNDIRRVSTGFLFLCLTISNGLHLLTLWFEFLDVSYNVQVSSWEFVRCRLIYYFQNVFRSLSSFITCTISIDRMFRAIYPMRAKRFCSIRTVRILLITYMVFFVCFYVFYLFPYIKENENGVCSTNFHNNYHRFMTVIWPPFRAVLICFFPASIMIVCNIYLWKEVRASKRRVAPRFSHSSKTETMLMLITIYNVTAFMLTQIPFHVYTSIIYYIDTGEHIRVPILLWSSLYFGVSFYIYCLSTPHFRNRFIESVHDCFKIHPNQRSQFRTRIHQILS